MKMRFLALESVGNPENPTFDLVVKGKTYGPEALKIFSQAWGIDSFKCYVIIGETDKDCLLTQIRIVEDMLFNEA